MEANDILSSKKYFLVGEIHGTRECPAIFLDFIRVYDIGNVALEIPRDYQKEVEEYFLSKRKLENLSWFRDKEKNHDGRKSDSMKQLVRILKERRVRVFLVDILEKSFEQIALHKRDDIMACSLLELDRRIAFLCGNVHVMKQPLYLPLDSPFYDQYPLGVVQTCGSFLPEEESVSVQIHALNGGTFFNCGYKSYNPDKIQQRRVDRTNLPCIIPSKDPSFDFQYLIERFSAST